MRLLDALECKSVAGGVTRDQLVADEKAEHDYVTSVAMKQALGGFVPGGSASATAITRTYNGEAERLSDAVAQMRADNETIAMMDALGITSTEVPIQVDTSKIEPMVLNSGEEVLLQMTDQEVVIVTGERDSYFDIDNVVTEVEQVTDVDVEAVSDMSSFDNIDFGDDHDDEFS